MRAFAHFVDCLRTRAQEQGERTAFMYLRDDVTEREEWTYGRLDEEARRIAGHLQTRGEEGDRVLLLHPPGPEFIAAFFGCLYAGRVAVPVPLPASPRRLSSVVPVCEDAQPSTVLSTEGLSLLLQEFLQPRLGAQVVWLQQEALAPEAARAWTPPSLSPERLAFLQYTSGSMGARRGVRVGHGQLMHNSEVIRRAFGHTPESRGVVWLPHFHDMGLIGGILQPIYCGFPVVLLSPLAFLQRPGLWLQAISTFHATTSGGPNFAYERVCEQVTEEQRASLDLSSWDVAFTGAEPVRARTLERFSTLFQPQGFRRSAFLPCYGLAEATLFVLGTPKHAPPRLETVDAEALQAHHAVPVAPGASGARTLVGCGVPGLDTRVEIVHPETRLPCVPGEVGELWVSGPSVAQGYWRRPEETQATFQARRADGAPGTFLRTGDLGFVLGEEFFITGRHRELIILQGRNHYPQDIEATAAAASPLLRPQGAIAFGVEQETGEVLVLVQEVRRGAEQPERALDAIRGAVAEEHGIEPAAVVLVAPGSLPRTTSGKPQRTACREAWLEGRLPVLASWRASAPPSRAPESSAPRASRRPPPAEEIERWIREHMATRLGKPLEHLRADESFASQGLGSVSAVGLAGELCTWLGRPLPPTLLYEYPTPEALARFLADGEDVSGQGAAPVRPAPSREPLALVGIGCRFPGASGPEDFWRLLHEGRDAIRPGSFPRRVETLGARAWPGGYLEDVEGFDAAFFGISPREAGFMDPQHRLLLEVGREALEHAGQPIDALRGSATGVFIGISGNEYGHLQAARCQASPSPYLATGSALSIAAARLSYCFDFHGPSLALDTACSSSLVAVHEACESLRRGECDLALAGGVNLMLDPRVTASFLLAGMLSPEGQCRTFDAGAQGYVRGEGCGLVVLKRLSDALAARDPILALLRGSAINQDGHSNGLTAPNGQAQEAVLRRALADAGVEPSAIGYLEAHGTGTPLGDPIEARAFTRVLGEGRLPGQRCWVGSVKTNLGHLEAAAGVAGLIKTALALHHEEVPRHLHFTRLNPQVPFEGTPFAVATASQVWPRTSTRRLAGVSAFGFGGTNAHVVLEEAPPRPAARPAARPERPLHLLTVSAHEASALRERMERFARALDGPEAPALADFAASANACGPHLEHRVALVAASSAEAAHALRQLAARAMPPRVDLRSSAPGSHESPRPEELLERLDSLVPGQPEWETLLERLADLYRHGARVDWARLDGAWERRRVPLPAYPFQHQRYGLEPTAPSDSEHPLLGPALAIAGARQVRFERVFERDVPLRLSDHVVEGEALLPAAAFCEMALAAGQRVFQQPVVVRGLHLSRPLPLGPGARVRVQCAVELSGEREARFELLSAPADEAPLQARWTVHCTARLSAEAPVSPSPFVAPEQGARVDLDGLYRGLEERGLHHGPTFRTLRELTVRGATVVAQVQRSSEDLEPGWGLSPTLLDGCFQALGALPGAASGPVPYLPVGLESLWLLRPGVTALTCVATRRDAAEEGGLTVDLVLLRQGQRIAEVRGLRLVARRSLPDWLYRLDWRAQALAGPAAPGPRLEDLEAECEEVSRPTAELERYAQALAALESLGTGYAASALRELGLSLVPGEMFAEEGLASRLGVVAPHQRLFHRLLRMLAEDGVLGREGGWWRVCREPSAAPSPQALEEARRRAPEEFTLLERCGGRLGELLRGRREPLEVLMPGGDLTPLTRLYQDSPGPRALNQLVRRVVEVAARASSESRPLRIIEVGGGTGGTTSHVLPGLDARRTTYLFTDVSPRMLRAAHARFGDCPFLRTRTLDLERPLEEQGLAEEHFDVVIAANVLHATADVRQALGHLRQRLAPGGWLVLLEGVEPLRWLDLTFGVTDGWWRFRDTDLRAEHALLSVERWQEVLVGSGFTRGQVLRPRLDSARQQAVIVSQVEEGQRGEREEPAPWLIVEDAGGVGQALARRLEAAGGQVRCVKPPGPEVVEGHEAEVPGEQAAFRELLGAQTWRGVVLLGGLDAPGASRASSEDLPLATAWACQGTLGTLQAYARGGRPGRSGVWIATRRAVSRRDGEAVEGLAQAPLWGLGRTVCLEKPDLRCHLVDLDDDSPDVQAEQLAAELLGDGREEQVVWRAQERFVARLVRVPPPGPARRGLSAEGTYLVTGAFGGLGRRVSQWLVEWGARSLVLLGRGEPSAEARQEIEALRRAGVSIAVARADVARLPELRRALLDACEGRPPLRGLFHCAGLLEDGALERMSWTRFARVLAPKVQGAWNLHTLTRTEPLEVFVLFSSAASLLGSPGQVNHSAANAFLDALAHHRRGLGLPAQSIDWGPWSEVGAAARPGRGDQLSQYGIDSLSPTEGRRFLETLLAQDGVQVGVLPIDWARWRELPAARTRSVFEDVLRPPLTRPEPPVSPPPTEPGPAVLPPPGPERLAFIEAYLLERVRRALELGDRPLDAHAPLGELGMDSISAIEIEHDIETRFGVQVQLTTLLEGVDLTGLARTVDSRLTASPPGETGDAAGPSPTAAPDAAGLLERLDELSESEVDALLADPPSSTGAAR